MLSYQRSGSRTVRMTLARGWAAISSRQKYAPGKSIMARKPSSSGRQSIGSPASLQCRASSQSGNRSGCAKFSRMWSQGPNPRRSTASRSDAVPVRPNPAPMTWRLDAGIPAGMGVWVITRAPFALWWQRTAPARALGTDAHPRPRRWDDLHPKCLMTVDQVNDAPADRGEQFSESGMKGVPEPVSYRSRVGRKEGGDDRDVFVRIGAVRSVTGVGDDPCLGLWQGSGDPEHDRRVERWALLAICQQDWSAEGGQPTEVERAAFGVAGLVEEGRGVSDARHVPRRQPGRDRRRPLLHLFGGPRIGGGVQGQIQEWGLVDGQATGQVGMPDREAQR